MQAEKIQFLQFLGIFGFAYLSLDRISFEIDTKSVILQSNIGSLMQYLPVIALGMLYFFSNLGVTSVPNIMISEVFPFKLVYFTPFFFHFFVKSK